MSNLGGNESGFSLIELLIAMLILSLGVMAMLGVMGTGIASAWMQREMTRTELAMINAAEDVRSAPYISCLVFDENTNNYTVADGVQVVEVRFVQLELDSLPPTLNVDNSNHFDVDCPTELVFSHNDPVTNQPVFVQEDQDYGLQAIMLRGLEDDGVTERFVTVMKRAS